MQLCSPGGQGRGRRGSGCSTQLHRPCGSNLRKPRGEGYAPCCERMWCHATCGDVTHCSSRRGANPFLQYFLLVSFPAQIQPLACYLWCELPGYERLLQKGGVFWERFRIVCGGHPVFARGKAALQRTCAMILHGDEGRSLKKTQLMVLALHSIMGFGSRVESDEAAHPDRQELNMQVHTWASRYLLAVLPRFMYDDRRDGNFQTVLAEISRDGNHLFEEGILGPDNQVYYVCILYVIGGLAPAAKDVQLPEKFQ